MGRLTAVALFAAGQLGAARADAQAALGRLAGTARDRFVGVISVREVSPTKALVLDTAEQVLAVVDFETGKAVQVGRMGDGPGEYRRAVGLVALGGDTTLVEDQHARRWIVVVGERPVTSVQLVGPPVRLAGADTLGHVLDVQPYAFRRSAGVPYAPSVVTAESLLVIRRVRMAGFASQGRSLSMRADTVVRLRGAGAAQSTVWRDRPPPASRWVLENPLVGSDEVALFQDGWIALLRREPYRVDWIDPRSVLHEGPVIERKLPRVPSAAKGDLARERWPAAEPPITEQEVPPWPDHLPPFINPALVRLAGGMVAVRRLGLTPVATTRYDVVTRASGIVSSMELPGRARIVGASDRYLYVVSEDEDDTEKLSRYTWERTGTTRTSARHYP